MMLARARSPGVQVSMDVLDDATCRRVRALVFHLGAQATSKALGIGFYTLQDACAPGGRMRPSTRERLLLALDRVEQERRIRP